MEDAVSRTDNTLPSRLRTADRPELQWTRILNTTSKHNKAKATLTRRFWAGERRRSKLAVRSGDEAPPLQSAHRVRANLW